MKILLPIITAVLLAGCTQVAEKSDFVCAKNDKVYTGYSHKSWEGKYTAMTLVYNDDNIRVPFAVTQKDLLLWFTCIPAKEFDVNNAAEMKSFRDQVRVAEEAKLVQRGEIK